MLHLLALVVPLGLAAAVSPVMLTEQTMLLSGPRSRATALLYAGGTVVVLVAVVGAVLVVGRSFSLPTAPHLDAALDLVLGGVLLVVGLVLARWRRPERGPASRVRPGPAAAFAFGVFAMATNLTTLALVLPAAKEVAADDVAGWERLVAAALLVVLACLPAWGPVALVEAAPATAGRVLDRISRAIHRHGRTAAVLLVGAAGLFLIARGTVRLAGL